MADEPNAPETSPGRAGTVTKSTNSETAHMTAEERDEYATKLVDRFTTWAGVAGFLPIPFVDMVAIGGLQLQMLRRLTQIYDVPFSENRGKALIAILFGTTIPTSSSLGASSVLKAIPVLGTAIAAFVTPVLAAGATYAIGKTFVQHFKSGGTLLDFKPPEYREFLNAQKEMWVKRSSEGPSKPSTSEHPNPSAGPAPAKS